MATLAEPMATAERCDGCRQRARYSALLASGGVLIFCAHHAYRHLDALALAGATVREIHEGKPAEDGEKKPKTRRAPFQQRGSHLRPGKGGESGPRQG